MTKIKKLGFDAIVFGFLLFQLGEILESSFDSQIGGILVKVIGWFFILKGFSNTHKKISNNTIESTYIRLVKIYMFLCIIMIIRGYFIDYPYQWNNFPSMINHHFFKIWYILPYLMPLILTIPIQEYKFDKYIKYASVFAVVSLILIVLNFNKILNNSIMSAQGFINESSRDTSDFVYYSVFSFAVLCFTYINKRQWELQLVGIISVVVIQMLGAHRGSVVLTSLIIFVAIYTYSRYNNRNKIWSYLIVIIMCAISIYISLRFHLIDFLLERGFEDNRSHVDEALLEQMSEFELWFGKGLNGRYYCDLGTLDQRFNGWRYGTETGFYNLVLKGGYVFAILYCLLLLIPSYKGIFKSNNMLCKVGGFYIFHSFLALYPFGWLMFDLHFLIIWMLIAICMSPNYRLKNDQEIKDLFFPRI